MGLLVNWILFRVTLILAAVRGTFEWADQALLAAAAVAIGAYLGARIALTHYDGPIRGRAVTSR
ncbi:MAG: hypothetical protein LC792_01705 [Actinobacteria bacterium]|nr:hypothetical protein [Actinomycetota bacterium]